jgi:pentafunctional AROM polypeptide
VIDLDAELENTSGKSIPQIIESQGWDDFRKAELNILKNVMQNRSEGYIFSCGGGVVEIPEARELFKTYKDTGGIVLFVHRDISQIIEFLDIDKTRPAYTSNIEPVWKRRKPWYFECSNYIYYSQAIDGKSVSNIKHNFKSFLLQITGEINPLENIILRAQSFFVALTVPNIPDYVDVIKSSTADCDAIELRVDLMVDNTSQDGIPTSDFLIQQISLLRSITQLPLIFTLRTKGQSGNFPDDAVEQAMTLYQLAASLAIEFIDLELQFPISVLEKVKANKLHSAIIASHHDPQGSLSWANGSWIPYYNKALQYGDVVKLVGKATKREDNFALSRFKNWAEESHKVPLIAINMGNEGKLSRVLNCFMTPVSHPTLPFKAAPGQLSATEIRQALSLLGELDARNFCLFGKPISASPSPILHNTLFKAFGLPHNYKRQETVDTNFIKSIIRETGFGGASVTIPMKLEVMSLLDELSEDVKVIGAVNTIVPVTSGQDTKLIGHNTDWQGMVHCFHRAGARQSPGDTAVVIGGGGTARAAIYAAHKMGYAPIYIVGRSQAKLRALINTFPSNYKLETLDTVEAIPQLPSIPVIAIGTIPADKPIDQDMREVLATLFHTNSNGTPRILVEMAYKPRVTALMRLAEDAGWDTVPGVDVLVGQGIYQVSLTRS